MWAPRWRSAVLLLLGALLALAALAPAALLVHQQRQSEQEMLDIAQRRTAAIDRITTLAVEGVLRTSRDAITVAASRPSTVEAFALPPGPQRDDALEALVDELQRADSAALASYAVDPDGVLRRNSPVNADLHGRSFAERDWYRGALAQYGTYVSEAFASALPDSPLVLGLARTVRDRQGRVLGLLGSAVRVDAVQELVDAQTGLPGVRITVVDRYGQVFARTGGVATIGPSTERRLREFPAGAGPRSGRPARAEAGEVWAAARLSGDEGSVLVEVPGSVVVGDLVEQQQTTRTVLAVIAVILLAGGGLAVRLGRGRLTAQGALRAALVTVEAQRQQLALSARMAGVGSFTVDPVTSVSTYSDEVLALWGLAADDPRRHDGRLFREQVLHPEDREELVARLHAVLERGGTDSAVARVHRLDDGSLRYLRVTLSRERVDDELAPVAHGGMLDVTALEQARREAEASGARHRAAAERDMLTGLPNRGLLADRLREALARSRRSGEPVAVLLVDLDGFKRVNDTAGHAAGDALLVEVARRLQACVREGDTVARLGGDEFVLVLEHAAGDALDAQTAAVLVARRVREAVAEPVVVGGVAHHVTASTGLAFSRSDADEADLLRDADAAMYRAKGSGKDRYEVFEVALRAEAERRAHVEAALRQALERRRDLPSPRDPSGQPAAARLWVAYQPVVREDGTVTGVEALARLDDAAGQPVPPQELVAVAEGAGLVPALGSAVLEDALGVCAAWRREHPELHVAVNLSALQAREPGLVRDVRRALERHRLPPHALVLEVTESVLLEAGGPQGSALRALHALGVGLAIDDFGTGDASLRHLAELPVDVVKVDRSFVAGLPGDRVGAAVVGAVARLADELGLRCVAEGVETEVQRAALPPGVLVQGYLLGRPGPAADVDLTARPALVSAAWAE